MAITRHVLIISTVVCLFVHLSLAQKCKNYEFPGKTVYRSCTDLPTLQAHLYWTHDPSTKTGINPDGTGMVGTQALVAFQDDQGKTKAYTTKVNSYSPEMKPEPLSFSVTRLSAQYLNKEMIVSAVVGPLSNGTTLNIVWQAGNSVKNNVPQMHSLGGQNVKSYRALDFLSS
ncbi:hypothetical protein RND81_11G091800 [Saponaria officinalis]|uniref:AIR12 DOMON domain-containing protein n=1 Tax=Saponaria officinalis TaxID=3572 RepID=A0AAW1HKU9_SAPOF